MSKPFSFFVGNEEIQQKLDFDQLNKLPKNIRDMLFQEGKYIVKSNVDNHVFHKFLDCFLDENRIPEINVDNIYQYHLLSEEFNFMKDYLSNNEFENLLKISVLITTSKTEIADKKEFESYISQNLDFYLDNYSKDLYKIPISSLYNIFNNDSRILNDHEKAYNFIINSNSEEFFILINLLDSSKLSSPILKESISKQNDHFGFVPNGTFSFLGTLEQKVSLFDEKINEIRSQFSKGNDNDKLLIDDLKKEIENLNKKVTNDEEIIDQLRKSNKEIKNNLIHDLNGLPLKSQQDMVNRAIIYSNNMKYIQFLTNFNNLVSFLSKYQISKEGKYFEFQIIDENKYLLQILCTLTDIIYKNNLFKSEEFKNLIKEIEKVSIEVKYPDKNYDKICDCIYEMNKLYIVNQGIFITGVNEVESKNQRSNFSSVKLDSCVTKISDKAFYCWKYMEKINIPSSVSYIGESGFINCESLTQIVLPFGITKISKSTFKGCSLLNMILIPSSVTSIDESAFMDCSSLTQISIPFSVSYIGDDAFKGCKSLFQITIPSKVTKINKGLFINCTSLESISILSNATSIEESAFEGCSSLINFSIPDSVSLIEKSAFQDCISLQRISIPSLITTIKEKSFCGCSNLKQITLPSSLTSIESYAFSKCVSLPFVRIPSSVTSIEKSAFNGCISLTQFVIPSSITTIESSVFQKCKSLSYVIIPSSVTKINSNAFSKCSSLEQFTIPSSIQILNYGVFEYCLFKEITIPSSVTEIDSYAFRGCSSLTKIIIPSSVQSIKSYAFSDCTSLVQIDIPSVKIIHTNTFNNCSSLKEITIPPSVESIHEGAFEGCSSLKQIEIPSSVKKIDENTFAKCKSLIQVTIPSSVKSIHEGAFEGCSSLKQIEIPSSVTEIGQNSFYNCTSLTKLSISSSVTEIKRNTFANCASLIQVIIPPSVKSIYEGAFKGCSSLKQIEIPSSVNEIGQNSFYNCTSLTKLSISSSVTEIKRNTFANCTSLAHVTIPPSVKSIYEGAFSDCTSLVKIEPLSSISKLGLNAFSGCSSLTQITLPSSLRNIEPLMFYNCTSLKKLTIPSSVTHIDIFAFAKCTSLEQVSIPSSVSIIDQYAFYKCVSLQKVTISSSETTVAPSAFYECSLLKKDSNNDYKVIPPVFINELKIVKNSCFDFIANLINSGEKLMAFECSNKFFSFSQRLNFNLPGFIKIKHTCFAPPNKYYVITEFLNNGDVDSILKQYFKSERTDSEKMNPTIRSKIIFGVAWTIKQFHKRNIVHLNLRTKNVFLDENLEPVIGLPYDVPNRLDDVRIPFSFHFPSEFYFDYYQDMPFDVYSFAFFIYQMFSEIIGLPKYRSDFQLFNLLNGGWRPKRPINISNFYWELIENCWDSNPDNRPTFDEIIDYLKSNESIIEEFGSYTDLRQLHEYQKRLESEE